MSEHATHRALCHLGRRLLNEHRMEGLECVISIGMSFDADVWNKAAVMLNLGILDEVNAELVKIRETFGEQPFQLSGHFKPAPSLTLVRPEARLVEEGEPTLREAADADLRAEFRRRGLDQPRAATLKEGWSLGDKPHPDAEAVAYCDVDEWHLHWVVDGDALDDDGGIISWPFNEDRASGKDMERAGFRVE